MKKKGSQLLSVQEFPHFVQRRSVSSSSRTPARSTRSIPGSVWSRQPTFPERPPIRSFLSSVSSTDVLGAFDKMFFMPPLATIVAGAHHSTLEVATPLSQNGLIDYAVGQYTSLYPKHRKSNPAAGGLKSALEAAEKHKQNHLMCRLHGDFKNKDIEVAELTSSIRRKPASFSRWRTRKTPGAFQKEMHSQPKPTCAPTCRKTASRRPPKPRPFQTRTLRL